MLTAVGGFSRGAGLGAGAGSAGAGSSRLQAVKTSAVARNRVVGRIRMNHSSKDAAGAAWVPTAQGCEGGVCHLVARMTPQASRAPALPLGWLR